MTRRGGKKKLKKLERTKNFFNFGEQREKVVSNGCKNFKKKFLLRFFPFFCGV
jgi:hypothetical protein